MTIMAEILSAKYVLLVVRVGLTIALITSTVTFDNISWTSFLLCVTNLALTFILPRYQKSCSKLYVQVAKLENPYKGKIGLGYISFERDMEIAKAVSELVLYDASSVASVRHFTVIKNNTECIFAKRSKLWGSPDYDDSLSLEENTRRLIPTFYKFTMAVQDLGLDAFLIELPGKLYGQNIQIFGNAVRTILFTMRQSDTWRQKQELLKYKKFDEVALKNYFGDLEVDTTTWSKRNWVFEFNKITFFITTFAPFYPKTNSRYAFGCENCYILFQPELSFAIHDLPSDTALTNWTRPVTVRDRVRIAFRDAGREYEPPLIHGKPMVYEIVKPIHSDDEDSLWWLQQQNS